MKTVFLVLVSCFGFLKLVNAQATDSLAQNMLVYQRSVGGWPKAVNMVPVDYKKTLTEKMRISIKADSLHEDATIDNNATTREILYLVKAYKNTKNTAYLKAVEKGLNYLFKAQYANGGWPQYYPERHIYRAEITYNDNAMINVMNVLQDVTEGKNGFEVLDAVYKKQALSAVEKGIDCIIKTQLCVKGKLTAWCAQYNEITLEPANARAFELISLSGMESVGIVEFLMRLPQPSTEVKHAINSAMEWFKTSKIEGYNFVLISDPLQPKGKDRVLVKEPGSTIWARFYEIDTNVPFFTGRDGIKKNTVAEIEVERRLGYAWYGTWPAKLFAKEYPEWLKRIR